MVILRNSKKLKKYPSMSQEDDVEGGYSSSNSSVSASSNDSIGFPIRHTLRKRASAGDLPSHGLSNSFRRSLTQRGPELNQFSCFPKERKESTKASRANSLLSFLSFLLFSGAIAYAGFRSRSRAYKEKINLVKLSHESLRGAYDFVVGELAETSRSFSAMKDSYDKMVEASHSMGTHMHKLEADLQNRKNLMEESAAKLKAKESEAVRAEERWNRMVQTIQERDRLEVIKKYGSGPHFVELQLELPSSPSIHKIKIQMAPLEYMPHSIHTFLTQISQQLWDGKMFDIHAGHVLLASPRTHAQHDEVPSDDASSAPRVLFPEFYRKFPHAKYTVAFPGRPDSGSNFYINLDHNNPHHSPHVDDDGRQVEGEPCFGNIIEGRDVVDLMDRLPINSNGVLNQPVIIKSARVL